jgi:hypothetical protein
MLNFIVLGYVPGTSVQLSFYVIALAIYILMLLDMFVMLMQFRQSRRKLASAMPYLIKKPLRNWFRQNTLTVEL